jgi:hypothetical protein
MGVPRATKFEHVDAPNAKYAAFLAKLVVVKRWVVEHVPGSSWRLGIVI